MVQSSTKSINQKEHPHSAELDWYFVQPAFKQLRFSDWLIGFICFFLLACLIAYFFPSLILESAFAVVILPLLCILTVWFVLQLQPHRQIFYRIDKYGIYSEFRQSTSPLMSKIAIFITVVLSLFGIKNPSFLNKHSSKSREFEWKDIVSIQESQSMNKIVLQAGLKGKMYVFTPPKQFKEVLMLVTEYVNQSRTTYD